MPTTNKRNKYTIDVNNKLIAWTDDKPMVRYQLLKLLSKYYGIESINIPKGLL